MRVQVEAVVDPLRHDEDGEANERPEPERADAGEAAPQHERRRRRAADEANAGRHHRDHGRLARHPAVVAQLVDRRREGGDAQVQHERDEGARQHVGVVRVAHHREAVEGQQQEERDDARHDLERRDAQLVEPRHHGQVREHEERRHDGHAPRDVRRRERVHQERPKASDAAERDDRARDHCHVADLEVVDANGAADGAHEGRVLGPAVHAVHAAATDAAVVAVAARLRRAHQEREVGLAPRLQHHRRRRERRDAEHRQRERQVRPRDALQQDAGRKRAQVRDDGRHDGDARRARRPGALVRVPERGAVHGEEDDVHDGDEHAREAELVLRVVGAEHRHRRERRVGEPDRADESAEGERAQHEEHGRRLAALDVRVVLALLLVVVPVARPVRARAPRRAALAAQRVPPCARVRLPPVVRRAAVARRRLLAVFRRHYNGHRHIRAARVLHALRLARAVGSRLAAVVAAGASGAVVTGVAGLPVIAASVAAVAAAVTAGGGRRRRRRRADLVAAGALANVLALHLAGVGGLVARRDRNVDVHQLRVLRRRVVAAAGSPAGVPARRQRLLDDAQRLVRAAGRAARGDAAIHLQDADAPDEAVAHQVVLAALARVVVLHVRLPQALIRDLGIARGQDRDELLHREAAEGHGEHDVYRREPEQPPIRTVDDQHGPRRRHHRQQLAGRLEEARAVQREEAHVHEEHGGKDHEPEHLGGARAGLRARQRRRVGPVDHRKDEQHRQRHAVQVVGREVLVQPRGRRLVLARL
mmetsp:Transcript_6299/g.22411  ORF Transcript_6299/g.22411 Transcript_6299/m.22411 type:complete len:763 (-) Transcript_6299:1112-3400(-)